MKADKNLDNTLKAYFSHNEDVPSVVKNQLRAKLYEYKAKEKLHWLWVFAPCFATIALLMLVAAYVIFGFVGMVVLLLVYYFAVSLCGAAIVITNFGAKPRLIER